jgi:hypothetical protein
VGTLSERKHHRSLTNRDPHCDPQSPPPHGDANTVQFPLAPPTTKKLATQNPSLLSTNTKNLVDKIREGQKKKSGRFEVPATSFASVDTKARLDLTKKRGEQASPTVKNDNFLPLTVKKNSGKLSAKTQDLIKRVQEKKNRGACEETLIDQLESNKLSSKKIVEESTVIGRDNTVSKVNEILNLPSAKDRYAELVAPGKILVLPVGFNR